MRILTAVFVTLSCCVTLLAQTTGQLPPSCFIIGSSGQTVLNIMGAADGVTFFDRENGDLTLRYGSGTIDFRDSKVVDWENLAGKPLPANPPALTYGETNIEVLSALGMPNSAYQDLKPSADGTAGIERWLYGKSTLIFLGNTLAAWSLTAPLTAVSLKKGPATKLALDTTGDTVLRVIDAPSGLTPTSDAKTMTWQYGKASLTLTNNAIIAWMNLARTLPISLGDPNPTGAPPTVGSSKADVITYWGTPFAILPRDDNTALWFYDKTTLAINDQGKVVDIATAAYQQQVTDKLKSPNDWPAFSNWALAQNSLAGPPAPKTASAAKPGGATTPDGSSTDSTAQTAPPQPQQPTAPTVDLTFLTDPRYPRFLQRCSTQLLLATRMPGVTQFYRDAVNDCVISRSVNKDKLSNPEYIRGIQSVSNAFSSFINGLVAPL